MQLTLYQVHDKGSRDRALRSVMVCSAKSSKSFSSEKCQPRNQPAPPVNKNQSSNQIFSLEGYTRFCRRHGWVLMHARTNSAYSNMRFLRCPQSPCVISRIGNATLIMVRVGYYQIKVYHRIFVKIFGFHLAGPHKFTLSAYGSLLYHLGPN